MAAGDTHIAPGDTLTFTITGKVVDPGLADTHDAMTLRIIRPSPTPGATAVLKVDAVLEPGAKFDFDIKSRFKNGVYIDNGGRYWMRRPDGWHEMTIAYSAALNPVSGQFSPPGAQRLEEDKDS